LTLSIVCVINREVPGVDPKIFLWSMGICVAELISRFGIPF